MHTTWTGTIAEEDHNMDTTWTGTIAEDKAFEPGAGFSDHWPTFNEGRNDATEQPVASGPGTVLDG